MTEYDKVGHAKVPDHSDTDPKQFRQIKIHFEFV